MQNNGLKYGVYGALVIVVYLLGLYFVDNKLLVNGFVAYWLPLVFLMPPIMYKACIDELRQNGSKDFRATLRAPFLVFALANVAFWLCLYGLHLADPNITRMELTQQLAFAQDQLKQGMGDPQQMNQIRQQVSDIQAEMNHIQQPLGPYLFSMMIWMLLGFGISAGVTGIVRAR
jgi:Protein of unknown function (DUF4199)